MLRNLIFLVVTLLLASLAIYTTYTHDGFSNGAWSIFLFLTLIFVYCCLYTYKHIASLKSQISIPEVKILLGIIIVGFILDAVSTFWFIKLWGLSSEANRLLIFLAERMSLLGSIAFMTLWAVPVVVTLVLCYNRQKHIGKLLFGLGAAKAAVGIFNFGMIIAFG